MLEAADGIARILTTCLGRRADELYEEIRLHRISRESGEEEEVSDNEEPLIVTKRRRVMQRCAVTHAWEPP